MIFPCCLTYLSESKCIDFITPPKMDLFANVTSLFIAYVTSLFIEKSIGTTELHYSTKKRENVPSFLCYSEVL